ncbi:MAG: AbrB/MazE/SpoVT family DNA-binding domain-containing protein [Anaerolineales bacterium]|jgi:antitoxin MazE|nr:AbrB/MazE/SpoVT family DNA-binding domain-containing protein [Anaerolineales bacterium]
MNMVRTQIVKIGNSRGVRLPKLLIDQMGFDNEVEILVQRGQLVLRPVALPRRGWDEQFKAMAKNGDDRLIDEPATTKWDRSEWKW